MPYAAAYDRPLKRRKAMGRKIMKARAKPSLSNVFPARGLVKKKQTAIMRYFERGELAAPTLGVPSSVIYRVNGLFDPEVSIGGQQPRGYDELSALYKKYRVTRACIEVWATIPTSATGVNLNIRMTNDNNPSTAVKDIMEDPELVTTLICDERPGYLKKEVDLKKYMLDFDADDYVGICASSLPTEQYFFHVDIVGVGTTGVTGPAKANIRITYEAEFFDPQTPGPS